jgi:predicted type IV restriction endonuclease
MDPSGLVWIGSIVAVLIFLDLLFVELRRIFREGKRLVGRLLAYADLPIFTLIAASENDVDRIVRAVDALASLAGRMQAALESLRRCYKPKGSSPG